MSHLALYLDQLKAVHQIILIILLTLQALWVTALWIRQYARLAGTRVAAIMTYIACMDTQS